MEADAHHIGPPVIGDDAVVVQRAVLAHEHRIANRNPAQPDWFAAIQQLVAGNRQAVFGSTRWRRTGNPTSQRSSSGLQKRTAIHAHRHAQSVITRPQNFGTALRSVRNAPISTSSLAGSTRMASST